MTTSTPAKKKARPPAPAAVKPCKYTGFDRVSLQRRPGLEYLVACVNYLTGNRVWNNGTLAIRPIRGGVAPSVHSTGRAADLSFRDMKDGKRGTGATRADAERVIEWLVANAEQLGVELVLDYWPRPHGRGWRCDRRSWVNYPTRTIAGAPGGDWFHLEVSPRMADDLPAMKAAVAAALGGAQ
jgi:hypothetical protein